MSKNIKPYNDEEPMPDCRTCKIPTIEMRNFYICPKCMADYSGDNIMSLLDRLNKLYSNDARKVRGSLQHLADADRESLRLLLYQKKLVRQTFTWLDKVYKHKLLDTTPYRRLEDE